MKRAFFSLTTALAVGLCGSVFGADIAPAPVSHMPQVNAELYDSMLEKIKAQLGPGYNYRRVGIFIIASNIKDQKALDFFVNHTLLKSAEAMWNTYFEKKPNYPIYVYLLADLRSYRAFARRYFGSDRGTPYGFYEHKYKALVMNMQPGDGTLSHELTHALIYPDFPQVPAWFNEGLGSLHERAVIDPHELIGKPNWRHGELLENIQKKSHTPLRKLMTTNTRDFHNERNSLHYAQARYLCMYLQQKGLLAQYYKTYRDNFNSDPSGQKSLEKVLGKSLEEIEKDWIEWFLKLPPPK